MTYLLEDLCHFLSHSPTSWHAVEEMGNRFASLDFTPLDLGEKWELKKGGKYFLVHEGSLMAFILPDNKPEKMALAAAHTDSPALKLKPQPEIHTHNMLRLGVEIYGGPILPTWFNRDLGIAGRVIVEQEKGKLEEHLVFFDESPVMIPLIAPHLDREIYKDGLKLDKQKHLVALASLQNDEVNAPYLETLLRQHLRFKTLHDFDLFLVPLDPPRFMGRNSEMLASYRVDNLVSSHAAIVALGNLKKPSKHLLSMGVFWDHEEVGSTTHTGAVSPYFQDAFERICHFYKLTQEEESILRRRSLCLSVDMCQAFNPNFEEKYDPQHRSQMGGGIAIKYNAQMRYNTSAAGGAIVSKICHDLNLNVQKFVNRTDNPSGSTIGPLFASRMGIDVVDIGIAQLSMHATREIISTQDYLDLCKVLTHFLEKG